jgi:hypothetical protein
MGKVRNHKIICALLAIAIMISGICLGEIQASSYFSCKQESAINTPDSIKGEDSVYRNERLSQKEVISSIRQVRNVARRINSRAEYETELCPVNVEVLPQKIHFTWAMDDGYYLEHLCKIAIITYIHEQDGEKA